VVRVWDTEHLDRKPLELDQARGSLGQVTLSPDADVSRVAVTTSEGDVYVWDRASGRLLAVMNRHADAADEAAFDPQDIDHMYSAGDDGFMVSYSCDLCSMGVDDLEDAIKDRVAQVVRLDE
jgi:WD40 repeat protein